MKKKTILALTAASIMMTCTTTFAGPEMFAAVPDKHWSYDAVKDLAQAGIIDGYETGYNGRSKITRYEMAIMVANAMTNSGKATVQQKANLDKLTKEFSSELVSLGATVSKETKQPQAAAPAPSALSKVKISFEERLSYNYTTLGDSDGGAVGAAAGIVDKNQFSHRLRVMIDTPFGENDEWMFKSRLFTQKTNLSKGSATAFQFDRYYVTNNNILGGKLEVGKNFVHPGKAGFFNLAGDTDSVIYTWTAPDKKFSTRVGIGRATPHMAVGANNDTTGVFLGELKFKPTSTSDIALYNIKQDGWNNGKIKDFNLWGLAGAMEINKKSGLALSFEVAQNKPSGDYESKTGWWVALNSNYKATIYNPGMFVTLVNPNKKGDQGWALSYRHMPSGVAGNGNRTALIPWLPFSTDTAGTAGGTYQNAFNNINAWRFDYMYIPTKNVQLQFTFDHIKPIGGGWTNNSIQTAAVFMF